MRALLLIHAFALLFSLATGLPRKPRQELRLGDGEGAEVIRVSNEKTPIILTSENAVQDAENVIALDAAVNSTAPQAPTPVPESVAITTEPVPTNTPSLVPTVVDISTQNPANTPPPPANATSATPAEEDEEDSEEDGSEEEADEEDEEEDDDDEEEEDEADDEEEEDEEEDEAKAKKLLKKAKREVVAGEEVNHSFNEPEQAQVSEEENIVAATTTTGGKTSVSGLQGVVGSTSEDDEAESILRGPAKPATVVIT